MKGDASRRRGKIMNTNFDAFLSLDLGTANPTSVAMETITVEVTSENMFNDFAKAFINEATRVNPLLMDHMDLTEEEVENYCDYLLTKRIETVELNCKDFRKLKALYVPCWIQYVLFSIGEVNIRQKGIKLIPTCEKSTMTFEQALSVSEKIGSLSNDLQIVRDAMPRSIEGDVDVMSTAMIEGYVRGLEKVSHPAATYVTTFLGMKLKEEQAFKALYRVQYDDLEFIRSALTRQKGLY